MTRAQAIKLWNWVARVEAGLETRVAEHKTFIEYRHVLGLTNNDMWLRYVQAFPTEGSYWRAHCGTGTTYSTPADTPAEAVFKLLMGDIEEGS